MTATLPTPAPRSYLLEVNLAAPAGPGPGGTYGLTTSDAEDDKTATLSVDPNRGELRWRAARRGGDEGEGVLARLPAGFRAEAYHELLVRHEPEATTVVLDGVRMGSLPGRFWSGERLGVRGAHIPISATGIALTELR